MLTYEGTQSPSNNLENDITHENEDQIQKRRAIGVLDGAVVDDCDSDSEFNQSHAVHEEISMISKSNFCEKKTNDTMSKSRGELHIPVLCYTCKQPFTTLHFFYDQLCPSCANLNYRKRKQVHSHSQIQFNSYLLLSKDCRPNWEDRISHRWSSENWFSMLP
jgi:hypothetical protein